MEIEKFHIMEKISSEKPVSDFNEWVNEIRDHYDKSTWLVRYVWDSGNEKYMTTSIKYFNEFKFECKDPIYWKGNKGKTILGTINCFQDDFNLTLLNLKTGTISRTGFLVGDKGLPIFILNIYDLDKDNNIEFLTSTPFYEGEGSKITFWEWDTDQMIHYQGASDSGDLYKKSYPLNIPEK